MKQKWYQNISWNEEIEKHFFVKLNRVKHQGMQAQYLILQAGALAYTKDSELLEVAEMLVNKQLQEYYYTIYTSRAYCLMGDIYKLKGKHNNSLDYYKQSIDFEGNFPNVITNSFMEYSELAIKTNRTDLFEYIENMFAEERYISAVAFPRTKYLKYSILSIISKHKGDMENAKHYADLANESAGLQQSGFRYHQSLGLVNQRDEVLDELVRRE